MANPSARTDGATSARPRPPSYTALPFAGLTGRPALLQWIREFLEKSAVSGFFIEFGVFNGESMKQAYRILRDQVSAYVGLDSFRGLPRPKGVDLEALSLMPSFVEGNFRSQGYEFVVRNVLSGGMPPAMLALVEGFFSESCTPQLQQRLESLGTGKAAVIHLDADLYSSTIEALEFSYPFMQTGCWLLCDDYWCYGGASSCGAQKALRGFLARHPDILFQEYCSYQGWSKAFVVEKLSTDHARVESIHE